MAFRIKIDHDRVHESPLDAATGGKFVFSATASTLAQDIVHGRAGTFLISGYRGSGKTSYIRALQTEIVSKYPATEALFVYLNFSKFESHSILLRRLIREFYYQFSINEGKNPLFEKMHRIEKHEKTLKLFKSIYNRTYYDIQEISFKKKNKKTIWEKEFKTNLKDFLILVGTVLTFGITLPAWQVTMIQELWWMKHGITILAALGTVLQGWQISKRISLSREKGRKTQKSKFYDNEIAEHHLSEILEMFDTEKCKIVFVLDELDKIDDITIMSKLLNELKPTMLSGRASFIVVAGQNLYYDFHYAHSSDDHLLSSLFSKTKHITLPSLAELKDLVRSYSLTDLNALSVNDRILFEGYLDQLVLHSNLIVRRLNGSIRQAWVWDNLATYLHLDGKPDQYDRFSKAVVVLDEFRSTVVNSLGLPEPVRDYVNMQVLLYANALLKGAMREAYVTRSAEQSAIDQKLGVDIIDFCFRVRNALAEANVVTLPEQKKANETSSDKPADTSQTVKTETEGTYTESVLGEFSDFQKILRTVYGDLRALKASDYEKTDFTQLVKWFRDLHALTIPEIDDPFITGVFNDPKTLFEDRDIKTEALREFWKQKLEFSAYTHAVLLYYVKHLAVKAISSYQLAETSADTGTDFLLHPTEPANVDLLFEVKFRRDALGVLRDDLHACKERLMKHDTRTGKKNHLIFVLFSDSGSNGLQKIEFRFKQYVAQLFGEDAERVSLLSVYVGNIYTLRTEINKLEEDLVSGYTSFSDIFLHNQPQPKGQPEYDDDQSIAVFDVTSHNYLVRVTPDGLGNYWRVGIRFSRNAEFPEVMLRHFTDHPVVHLYWNGNSNNVMVAYYFKGLHDPLEFKTSINNPINEGYFFSITYSKNVTTVNVLNDQKEPIIEKPLVIHNAYLFRVCAWADGKSTFRWRVSVREQRSTGLQALVRSQASVNKDEVAIRVLGTDQKPVEHASIHFKNVSKPTEVFITNVDGVAWMRRPTSEQPNVLLVAADGYRGAILINVDYQWDIVLELKVLPYGISQIIFTNRESKLIEIDRMVKINFDQSGNPYLTSEKLLINKKVGPAHYIELDQVITLGSNTKDFELYFRYLDSNVALIEHHETKLSRIRSSITI